MTNEQQTFINTIGPLVQNCCTDYGYGVASVVIAQAIIESNWGKSKLSASYHNYFGLKCGSSWKGGSVNMKTNEEYTPGTLTAIRDNFRTYSSMEEGVKGYFDFIRTTRYTTARAQKEPLNFITELKNAGYATSSTYVNTIMNTVNTYNLTEWDGNTVTSEVIPPIITEETDKAENIGTIQTGYFLENGIMTLRAKTWLELKAIVEHLENVKNDTDLREIVTWLG